MSKKHITLTIAIVCLVGFPLIYITKNQTEQRLVDRICGRADALMMFYQQDDREHQIETDEAASACWIVREVTNKDYKNE